MEDTLLRSYCDSFLRGHLPNELFFRLIARDFSHQVSPHLNIAPQAPIVPVPAPSPVRSLNEPSISLFMKRERDVVIPALSLEVEITNQEKYQLYFPYELTNLDYLRRIMDFLQIPALTFVNYIKSICPRLQNQELKGECVYYLLKFLIKTINIWGTVTGIVPSSILPYLRYLHEIRNSFSHTRGDVRAPNSRNAFRLGDARTTIECFEKATYFLGMISAKLGTNNIEFALRNIEKLKRQYDTHKKWKHERKQLMQ